MLNQVAPVAPVAKITANTSLFQKLNDVSDSNAGAVITGEQTIEEVREASGEQLVRIMVKGHDDFIRWKRGISL